MIRHLLLECFRSTRTCAYAVVAFTFVLGSIQLTGMLLGGAAASAQELLDAPEADGSVPLDKRELKNLHGFAKLYGYVRYYYPGDEASRVDWERFVLHGTARVLPAANAEELAETLRGLFRPIAPALRIYLTDGEAPEPVTLPEPGSPEATGLTAVTWQHQGVGAAPGLELDAASLDTTLHRSVRIGRDADAPIFAPAAEIGEGIENPFTEGLSLAMPLAVWSDAEGTLPRADVDALAELERALAQVDPAAWDPSQKAHRVTPAIMAWNVWKHFGPHFDLLGVQWEQQLIFVLRATLKITDAAGVYNAFGEHLISRLGDGQARLLHPELEAKWAWLSLAVGRPEGLLTALASGIEGLRVGDIILTVDGERAADVMWREERIFGGSSQRRGDLAYPTFGRGEPGSKAVVEVRRFGEILDFETTRSQRQPFPFQQRQAAERIRKVDYFDLTAISVDALETSLDALASKKKARGVLFDVRGPVSDAVAIAVLRRLIKEPTMAPEQRLPRTIYPDQEGLSDWATTIPWEIEPRPAEERLTAPVAFLTDGLTAAVAERLIALVRNHQLGAIVGGLTAGIDGQVRTMTLPGGFQARWTSTRVAKPDGKQLFAIGIEPTSFVERSNWELRQGADEIVEEAIRVLQVERMKRR